MKRKFSKILGVGLTLALLTSLLLTGAPVSAVTTPVVTLGDGDTAVTQPAGVISKLNVYTVLFTAGVAVPAGDEIVVGFEAGTNITALTTGDVQIQSSAGIGGAQFVGTENPVVAVAGTYPDAQTLTITVPASPAGGVGAGAMVLLTIGKIDTLGCVTNPAAAGTYNLTVATQTAAAAAVIEAAVTSADYTIIVPTIAGLPGVASIYNPAGILMAQHNDLYAAIAAAGPDYTIQVGPGTYTLAEPNELTIAHEGLTLISTDGALTTIIDASNLTGGGVGDGAINITAAGVTVDGFTVLNASIGSGINIDAIDAIVRNNTVTFASFGTGIDVASFATGVTISGNTLNENAAIILHGSDCTVSGNTFGHIMNFWALGLLEDVTITDNNFVANENANFGILLRGEGGSTKIDDTLIEGNTINDRANGGILIGADGNVILTNLTITGNDIINNGDGTGTLDSGIRIYSGADWSAGNVIKFNTITGNEDYGILNEGTADIDATFNWWGPDGASVGAPGTGTVTTAPVLTDVAEAVFSASAAGTGTSLDAKTTVGVKVEGATDATIVAAKYIANPQEDKAGAIAFYDVYVAGTGTTDITIKFYAGDALTKVYLWSAGTEIWVEQTPVTFSVYGGFVSVDVDPAFLGGTPFALVGGVAEALTAPEIISPDVGEKDVDLRPAFAWTAIAGVLGYEFELADNPNFVAPLMRLSGELGRLIVPYYQYMPQLDYSSAYYWRVRAVDATAESGWSGGVFITVAEVEPEPEPEPRMWTCPQCGLTYSTRAKLEAHADWAHKPVEPPDIIVEPDVEVIVPLPAETPITPAWIYVIIAVGAVLVIALIVLIVRTRRVA